MPLTDQKKNKLVPHLSNRLQAVADLVPLCSRILDIGTDHALLPVYLISQNRCEQAVAIDINAGPLRVAAGRIHSSGLGDRIRVLRNDGLKDIPLDPQDVIILAGLGGFEIMGILDESLCDCRAIIIQAMKSLQELRPWLASHGYAIEQEKLVQEHDRYYVVIACRHSGEIQMLSKLDEWIGPVLLKERPPGFTGYLEKRLLQLRKQSRGAPDLLPVIHQIEELLAENPAIGGI
jgi:tRNA (adenine22-N1)-methyltransferase